MALPIYVVFLALYWQQKIDFLINVVGGCMLVQILAIFIMSFGRFALARAITLFIGMLSVFITIEYAGMSYGFQLFYMSTMALLFVIFDVEDLWQMIAFEVYIVLLYTINALGIFDLPVARDLALFYSPAFYYHLSFVISTALVSFSVGNFFYHSYHAQKQLELERARIAQASKMASLGEMASGIAHEINNPLAVISVVVERQYQKILKGDFDPQSRLDALRRVSRMVDRIAQIVTSLRVYAREGSQDAFRSVSVAKLVDETMALCEERFKRKSIQIQIDLKENLFVLAREVQILQVLVNLMNNAHDALLSHRLGKICLSATAEGDRVRIAVTDNGEGVSEKLKEKIFQPFFTTKDVGKGTGLGLSISQSIVLDHGGQLHCISKPGHCRFEFDLAKDNSQSTSASPQINSLNFALEEENIDIQT